MGKTVEINLPEDVYREAMEASKDSGQPLKDLLVDAVRCALKGYRVDFHCPVRDITQPGQQYNKTTIDAMKEPIDRNNKLDLKKFREFVAAL
jgi:hypothetical protein